MEILLENSLLIFQVLLQHLLQVVELGGRFSQRLWKGRSSHRAQGRLMGVSEAPPRWGETGWNPDSVLFTVVCGPGTYSPNNEVTCRTCARPQVGIYGAKSCY